MGKGKKIAVFILVIALLVVAYLAVTFLISDDTDETPDKPSEEIIISSLNIDEITAVSYDFEDEKICFVKDGDLWYLEKDKEFPLDQYTVTEILNSVMSLKASRLVSDKKEDFAEYGLSDSSSELVFTLSDGSETVYRIGYFNSFSDSYYLNIASEDKIYLVPSSFVALFQKNTTDFADVEDLTTVSTDEVDGVNFVLDGENHVIFNEPDGLSTVYTDSYTWFSDRQTPLDPDAAQKLVGLVVAYTESGCADYSADADELTLYGFDNPTLSATVDYTVTEEVDTGETDENDLPVTETKTTEKVLNFSVGGKSEDGRYYVKEVQKGTVYLIESEYIDNLRGFDYGTLRYTDVCLISTEEIDEMAVTVNGKTSVIRISHSYDDQGMHQAEYTLNGEFMTATDFYGVYSSIQSIVSEGITDKTVSGTDADITVVYKLNREGFSEMTLKFIPLDRSFYVVDFNGRCDILVNKRDVEIVAETVNALKG